MIENQRKNREKARDSECYGLIISACIWMLAIRISYGLPRLHSCRQFLGVAGILWVKVIRNIGSRRKVKNCFDTSTRDSARSIQKSCLSKVFVMFQKEFLVR